MGSIVIDVGAGCKSEYIEWVRQKPTLQIHAIEPHPELADNLKKDFTGLVANGNLHVYEFACVSDSIQPNHRVDFFFCNHKTCSSTLPFADINAPRKWKYPPGASEHFEMHSCFFVDAFTLDEFVAEIPPFQTIDLLNIDVQGDSLNVLRGLKSSETWDKIRKVVVKVHVIDWELYRGQSKYSQIVELLQSKKYVVVSEQLISRNQEKIVLFKLPADLRKPRKKKPTPKAAPPTPRPKRLLLGGFAAPGGPNLRMKKLITSTTKK